MFRMTTSMGVTVDMELYANPARYAEIVLFSNSLFNLSPIPAICLVLSVL